jgi:two-component system, OmpR family, sensor histidine kinase BaeS
MKARIAFHLVLSHLLMVALALGVFVLVVTRVTDRQATAAGVRSDQAAAARLAPWIERYYRDRGSWQGLARLLDERRLPPDPDIMSSPAMRSMMPQRGPAMRRPPTADSQLLILLEQPILLLSPDGAVLAARGVGERIVEMRRRNLTDGVPIGDHDDPIAYLFLGAMANPESNPVRLLFVRTMGSAAMTTALVVLLAAAAASYLWTRWLVRPLRAMGAAAAAMAGGDYRTRVNLPRLRDELFELSGSFNEMAAQIEAQEDARRRFVADAAHELRTPLSLIAARVDMLSSGVYAPLPDQWEALHNGIGRMQRLVDDLQTLARLEVGRIELHPQTLDVHAVLRQAVAAFEPVAAKRGVRLHSVIDAATLSNGAPVQVHADHERVHQILANFLSNAIRHSPSGGHVRVGAHGVDTEACAQGTHMVLWVEDEGPGVPESQRQRVFDRFVRLDDARDRDSGGSGLGLAIATELARLQHGSIRIVDSASGHGARVCLSLPATDREDRFRRNDT